MLGFYMSPPPQRGLWRGKAARKMPGPWHTGANGRQEKQLAEPAAFHICLIPSLMRWRGRYLTPLGVPASSLPFPMASTPSPSAQLRESVPDLTSPREIRRVSTGAMGMVQTQPICRRHLMSSHPTPSSPSILPPGLGSTRMWVTFLGQHGAGVQ